MTALVSSFWPLIIGGVAALLGLWGYGVRQRIVGAERERAKQAIAEKRARNVANQIDSDPLPADVAREELKKWGHQP